MKRNILEVDSVILEFGTRRVLQDVYFVSETDKVTGLLGRNGSGKSCLLKIIFGELASFDKSIRINGQPLLKTNRRPEDLRYLPQNLFIPDNLSIRRVFYDFNVDVTVFFRHFPEFKKNVRTRIKHLSQGEKRIIEIYLILVCRSKFCLLDEPFSQIMPIYVDRIKKIIIQEKSNKGIIITDHMYKHVVDISDDIYMVKSGKTYLTKSIYDLKKFGYVREINKDVK